MNQDVREFLRENKNLIAADDFEALYKKVLGTPRGRISEVLLKADINPLDYLNHVPDFFLYGSPVKSFTIPDGMTVIGNQAFRDCHNLKNITIPNSVTSIGWYAFYNCRRLTSITMGNNVTAIGEFAFSGCSGLTDIIIPNSVKVIGHYAFEKCSGLTSITFKGTADQWEEVEKGLGWSKRVSPQCKLLLDP